jgi:hypothetical protein
MAAERRARLQQQIAKKKATDTVSVGCENKYLSEAQHSLSQAAEISPGIHATALRHDVSEALRARAEEIAIYLINEEEAPQNKITSQLLSICHSIPVWTAVVERGWNINRRVPYG